ncbi:DUF4239 domain-containing protein [Dyella solisilvae]|uniref:DUF4239 domain-containing protein n=1 Tax=Dyella solisilvae TaxID=1920168 RepID=A0A370K9B2_9GAMM|nr:DUF4239 domain-containing protein [Dyella solisilvae]RDI99226.1 DUF4239 domain-containing protein [Dyella solisilvae]
MSHLLFSVFVFVCAFGCALLGMVMRTRLPGHHLDEDSATAIKLAAGLIATLAALVLGLLISSAKTTFDTVSQDFQHNAVNILRLDRTLAAYGPETKDLRASLKRSYSAWIDLIGAEESERRRSVDNPKVLAHINDFQHELAALRPATADQRILLSRAQDIFEEVFAARWMALLQKQGGIPTTLLLVLTAWLCVIFGTFGLFAPNNHTVIFFFLLCALSSAGAIFVIMEMDTPLGGLIHVSVQPLREAVSQLGQ